MPTNPTAQSIKTPTTVKVLMWNVSPSWADFLFSVSNVVLIIGAFAIFIGTIGSITMGAAKEHFADVRISDNERDTAQALARAGAADAKAAGLEKEAADARLETERLKQVVAWRTIMPPDALKLENALVGKPGVVNLRFMDGDPEALFLAIQFSKILSKAHWQVAPGALKPANAIVFGISLPDAASADAQTLRAAFVAAGIAFSPNPVPGGSSFSVSAIPGAPMLMIGSRPPPEFP